MTSIDISHLDYANLIALRDDINQRLLALRRTPAMRLDELLALFEETKIALADHGHQWHTLERWQWMDGEIRFWLNPKDTSRHMIGWFTIDDLIAWLQDSGAIMVLSVSRDIGMRWIDVNQKDD